MAQVGSFHHLRVTRHKRFLSLRLNEEAYFAVLTAKNCGKNTTQKVDHKQFWQQQSQMIQNV